MTAALVNAALWYARNGMPVFPCKPRGKEPLTPHGFKDATTDQARISEYWGRWPDANIGIPTGVTTGLLVVDCDPRNGGPADRSSFGEQFGPVPDTTEVITGGGGRHFYLRHSGGPVPKTLARGVDLKGDGGYVVAPPSIHQSGERYQVDGMVGARAFLNIAAAPDWLLERIAKVNPALQLSAATDDGKWDAGQRNNKLASLAGAMRRLDGTPETIKAALLQQNRSHCNPPLEEDEVLRIAESVSRYKPASDGRNQHASQETFKLTRLGDLLKEPEEVRDWLLDGLLPAGGLSLLVGKPKAGKSTWARCLAVAVSQGQLFLGKTTTQGPVLYLALEEKRGQVRKHFELLGVAGDEPIYVHAERAPTQAVAEARKIIEQHKPTLVIIDPLLKFTRVKDANDYAQVNAALEPLLVLARESGAHVLLVYHAGKGKTGDAVDSALGSTAFAAAVDTILTLRRSEHYRTLETVQRYGDDLPETVLDFDTDRRAVSLGVPKAKAEASRIADGILGFVKKRSGVTEAEIREAVEGRAKVKAASLRELLEEGRVTREGTGKKGDPYLYSIARQCSFPDSANTREQESNITGDLIETKDRILVPTMKPGTSISREREFSSESAGPASEPMAEEEV